MKELAQSDVNQVSGGFLPIVGRILLPSVINMITYGYKKHKNEEEITAKGLAIAGGSGALGGGIGVAGGLVAGGGIVANAVWMPSSMAVSTSGGAIAQEY